MTRRHRYVVRRFAAVILVLGSCSAPLAELGQEFAAGAYGDRDTVPGMYNYCDPAWNPPYDSPQLHTRQSVGKSITALVYGIAPLPR